MANIKSLLNDIRKNTGSESFAESKYGGVSNWISTGDYGLNRIISGSVHKGIPSGKIVILGGESQSGKSYICAKIIANALKDGYDMVFYFDSEGGALKDFFENMGADTSKIEQILVNSVEDCTVKVLSVYDKIEKFKTDNPDAKFLCVLDSLGALASDKMAKDAIDKKKQVSEMGGRAKHVNNLMRALIIRTMKTDTSMVVVNHIYDDPSAMYASKIKNQGGGRGLVYAAHLIIQCSKKLQKTEETDSENYSGSTVLKFMTTKNRIVRPTFETEMYLDFNEGPKKYFGLLKPALKYGFIKRESAQFYSVPTFSDKKWRLKQLLDEPEVWDTFLEAFDEKSLEDLGYGGNTPDIEDDFIDDCADMDEISVEESEKESEK